MTWIWKHFTPEEVLSPHGLEAYHRLGVILIQPILLDTLEQFRAFMGCPLIVNHASHVHRGYRSPKENEEVGGERFSFHMQGLAVDISVTEMSFQKFRDVITFFPQWKGLGFYPDKGFIHCDLRTTVSGNRMTWEG